MNLFFVSRSVWSFFIFFMMCAVTSVKAQSVSQKQIDEAMSVPLAYNTCGQNINTELWTDAIVGKDKAMYFLALTAHLDTNARSSDGRFVRDRVLEHLKNIISEDSNGKSREPSCRGDLAGWKDIGQVFAILLAKRTPIIWSKLTVDEVYKIDWLMRAFAVAGNYFNNFANWPTRCMYQTYGIGKTWNPNHNDGYVGVMIAAYYYFGGATAVNKILADFKYDTYLAKFGQLRFHNLEETWTAAGTSTYPNGKDVAYMKNLLENPDGTEQFDKGKGKVFGARMPFEFGNPPLATEKVPYDPVQLYRSISGWMYPHIVTNGSKTGAAYTLNNGTSPVLGRLGMCREFQITDGFIPNVSERSDARYAWWGWMMHITIVSAMMALDEWPASGEMSDPEQRMAVGSEDLIYKLKMGYHSFSLGKFTDYNDKQFTDQGYWLIVDIWNNFVKKRISKNSANKLNRIKK